MGVVKTVPGLFWPGSEGGVMLNIVLVEPEIPQNCGNIAQIGRAHV